MLVGGDNGGMCQYEEWKTADTLPIYEVSSFGRVRNKKTKNIIRTFSSKDRPYPYFTYESMNYYKKNYRVHRLVAEAFIGPCPEDKEVNHKDLNKSNNHISNLEYVTRSENIKHYYHLRNGF